MPRIRMVKPSFFKHADLYDAEVSSGFPLRIAYEALWTVADRRGVFQWSRNIKPDVIPYDPCDMLAVLDALASAGFIVKYEVEGKPYGFIPTMKDHQTFHKDEKPSKLPAPPELHGAIPVQAGCGPSSSPPSTSTASTTSTIASADEAAAAEPFRPLSFLTRCAVALNTGQQQNPAIQNPTEYPATSLAGRVSWEEDGIPIELVERVIAERCAAYKPNQRNRQIVSLTYFDAAVRDAWELSKAPAGPRSAPDLSGNAGAAFAKIRSLITTHDNPGRGTIRFIPKAEIEKLDPRAVAAYEQVGGAERFLDQTEKVGFLVRDFNDAFRAAGAS